MSLTQNKKRVDFNEVANTAALESGCVKQASDGLKDPTIHNRSTASVIITSTPAH